MIYIISYKLKRKNARRKIYAKMHYDTQYEAEKQFEHYVKNRPADDKPKIWELLTGDWKHITFYCPTCKTCMDYRCKMCNEYKKGNEEDGKP